MNELRFNLKSGPRILVLIAVCVLTLLFVSREDAVAITFDDGGTHEISGAESDVEISNNTTVNVVAGASITGSNGGTDGSDGITLLDTSTLIMSGGSVTGGMGVGRGGYGVGVGGGNVDISGGTLQGGSGGTSARAGLFVAAFDSLVISGGTFNGGNGDLSGAQGALLIGSGTGTISGGTFTGGTGGEFDGADLILAGDMVINLTGGAFAGPIGIQLNTNAVLNVFGDLTFDGGLLTGTLANGTPISKMVTLMDNSQLNIIPIPEPTTSGLAMIATLCLVAGRRRS